MKFSFFSYETRYHATTDYFETEHPCPEEHRVCCEGEVSYAGVSCLSKNFSINFIHHLAFCFLFDVMEKHTFLAMCLCSILPQWHTTLTLNRWEPNLDNAPYWVPGKNLSRMIMIDLFFQMLMSWENFLNISEANGSGYQGVLYNYEYEENSVAHICNADWIRNSFVLVMMMLTWIKY